MINNDMKIRDVLNESVTDVVARFYLEAGKDYDKFYNPEDIKYKEKNAKYYDEYFKEWFSEEVVPVFTKPVTKPQPEYTNSPKEGKLQSPGYRGLQYALAAAGLPYNHKVQRYEPNASRMLASQTMDGARNNNGN
jgi:hypothetical protein